MFHTWKEVKSIRADNHVCLFLLLHSNITTTHTENIINKNLDDDYENDDDLGYFNFDKYIFDRVELFRPSSMLENVEEERPISPTAIMSYEDVSAAPQYERFTLPRKSPKRKPVTISEEVKEDMQSRVDNAAKVISNGVNMDQAIYKDPDEIIDPVMLIPVLPSNTSSMSSLRPTSPLTHRTQYRSKSFEALSIYYPKASTTIECDDSLDLTLNRQETLDLELTSLIKSSRKVHERRDSGFHGQRRPSVGNSSSSFLMRSISSVNNLGRNRSFSVKEHELSDSISRLKQKLPGSWPFHKSSLRDELISNTTTH